MSAFSDLRIVKKLENHEHVTVVAFGSSNTQRRLPGMTWFDFVELGFKSAYGVGCGNFINAGIGGDTCQMLLDRIDRDVLAFKPDLVILTVGGNDSNPRHGVSAEDYARNVRAVYEQVTACGAEMIFQTYYACQMEHLPKGMPEKMDENMQIIRDIAAETHSPLQDHYLRWNRLRTRFPDTYNLLMENAMHVNPYGNQVLGLDLLRHLGVELPAEFRAELTTGYLGLSLLEALAEE